MKDIILGIGFLIGFILLLGALLQSYKMAKYNEEKNIKKGRLLKSISFMIVGVAFVIAPSIFQNACGCVVFAETENSVEYKDESFKTNEK